jgi:hypothetical protein
MPSVKTFAPAILLLAALAYFLWLFQFLTDPWTSWVHFESAEADPTLHNIMKLRWSTLLGEIVRGAGIDENPRRLRPVSHAVEHLDSYFRWSIVAVVGFVPALANLSSIIYFTVCPALAFLIAKRLVGLSVVGAILTALALAAFLTSVGYISASIFIIRPAKKIVILLTLLQLLIALWYVAEPRLRYVAMLGALQFVAALTDETGIASGVLIPVLAVALVLAMRRGSAWRFVWLLGFWIVTGAAFALGYLIRLPMIPPESADGLGSLIRALVIPGRTPGAGYIVELVFAHLAGSFSTLYGVGATKGLWLLIVRRRRWPS